MRFRDGVGGGGGGERSLKLFNRPHATASPSVPPRPPRKTQPKSVEGLEHDLRHALAVGLRVQRGLRQQHRVLLRGDAQLVVEGVVPDLLLRQI